MSHKQEFSLSNIKSEPNADTIDDIKVKNNFNDDWNPENDFKYNEGNVKAENSFGIKQEEIEIKDEIPYQDINYSKPDDIPSNTGTKIEDSCKIRSMKQEIEEDHANAKHEIPLYNFYIELHELDTVAKKPYECNICQFKTSSRGSLINHIRTHKQVKPFTCNLCEFKTVRKHYLTTHMRVHTGEKPFACYLCEFKTIRKSNLTSHVKTHTEEKPFACTLCEYKSFKKSDLERHIRAIHTGEKPFMCNICEYKSSAKSNLVTHMKIHPTEKPFMFKSAV